MSRRQFRRRTRECEKSNSVVFVNRECETFLSCRTRYRRVLKFANGWNRIRSDPQRRNGRTAMANTETSPR